MTGNVKIEVNQKLASFIHRLSFFQTLYVLYRSVKHLLLCKHERFLYQQYDTINYIL